MLSARFGWGARLVCARLGLALALMLAMPRAAAAQAFIVEVVPSEGALDAAAIRSAIEARGAELSACAPGSGPYAFVYALSVRSNGAVREASYDRGADSALAPARAARCIRHALLELSLPASAGAASVTLRMGSAPASAPAASAPAASAPAASAPAASAPASAPAASAPASAPAASAPAASAPAASAPAASAPARTPPTGPSPGAGPRRTESTASVSFGPAPSGARAIHDAAEAHQDSLVACYAGALAVDPTLTGTGALHLTIDPSGHVRRALLASDEHLASALGACVAAAARTWTFTVSAETTVSLPLTFGARGPTRR